MQRGLHSLARTLAAQLLKVGKDWPAGISVHGDGCVAAFANIKCETQQSRTVSKSVDGN